MAASVGFVVAAVRGSPTVFRVRGIRSWIGVWRTLSRMTLLVSEAVILGVVRVVERIDQGLEASDGRLLREVVIGHVSDVT